MTCYQEKTVDRYSEYYCLDCQTAADQAAEFAVREGHDVGAARKHALEGRSPGAMDHKHPLMPFDRFSSAALEERLKIEPGSLEDPRRGR